MEALVAGSGVTANGPRADKVCRLISLDKARVAVDIASPLLRHAETDIQASALELVCNVEAVGGAGLHSLETDAKDHGDGLSVLVDVGRRRGVGLDLGVVVGEDLVGDAALGRVAAGDVVLDDEATAILFSRCLDLVEDLNL